MDGKRWFDCSARHAIAGAAVVVWVAVGVLAYVAAPVLRAIAGTVVVLAGIIVLGLAGKLLHAAVSIERGYGSAITQVNPEADSRKPVTGVRARGMIFAHRILHHHH